MKPYFEHEGSAEASDRSALIIAHCPVVIARLREAAGGMGVRIGDVVSIDRAADRIGNDTGIASLLIGLNEAGDAELAALATIAGIAKLRALPMIVTFPVAAIDPVATMLMETCAQLLCEPSVIELSAAMALASRRSASPLLHDKARDGDRRLAQLQAEIARIAEMLSALTQSDGGAGQVNAPTLRGDWTAPEPATDLMDELDPGDVRRLIQARRLRDRFFEGEFFADPAWDMMLDLYAAQLERSDVSVSSLCIAAAVPPTTALRWITMLRDAGIFERRDDKSDKRRAFITLSEKGRIAMRQYFGTIMRQGLILV